MPGWRQAGWKPTDLTHTKRVATPWQMETAKFVILGRCNFDPEEP